MSAAGSPNFFCATCATNSSRDATAPGPKWPFAASRRFKRRSTECVTVNLLGSDVAGLDVGMGFGDGTRLRDDVTGLHNQVSWLGLLRISGPPVYRTPGSGRVAGGPWRSLRNRNASSTAFRRRW